MARKNDSTARTTTATDERHDMSTLISQVQRVPSTARTAGVLLASTALTVAVLAGLNSIVGSWA